MTGRETLGAAPTSLLVRAEVKIGTSVEPTRSMLACISYTKTHFLLELLATNVSFGGERLSLTASHLDLALYEFPNCR